MLNCLDLQLEEENHRKELKEIKDQLVIAEGDMSEQIKRREDLEKQENKYWKEYSKYKRDVSIQFGLEGKVLKCIAFYLLKLNIHVHFPASNGRRRL